MLELGILGCIGFSRLFRRFFGGFCRFHRSGDRQGPDFGNFFTLKRYPPWIFEDKRESFKAPLRVFGLTPPPPPAHAQAVTGLDPETIKLAYPRHRSPIVKRLPDFDDLGDLNVEIAGNLKLDPQQLLDVIVDSIAGRLKRRRDGHQPRSRR